MDPDGAWSTDPSQPPGAPDGPARQAALVSAGKKRTPGAKPHAGVVLGVGDGVLASLAVGATRPGVVGCRIGTRCRAGRCPTRRSTATVGCSATRSPRTSGDWRWSITVASCCACRPPRTTAQGAKVPVPVAESVFDWVAAAAEDRVHPGSRCRVQFSEGAAGFDTSHENVHEVRRDGRDVEVGRSSRSVGIHRLHWSQPPWRFPVGVRTNSRHSMVQDSAPRRSRF